MTQAFDETQLEFDEVTIVKLNSENTFYPGKVFVDDEELSVICSFGGYLFDVDISEKSKLDAGVFFESLEDEFFEVYEQEIEIHDSANYLDLAQDILISIKDSMVKSYCSKYTRLLEQSTDLENRVEVLNELLEYSILSKEDLPEIEQEFLYDKTRGLFSFINRTSKVVDHRFTVPKKILDNYEDNSTYLINIELIQSNTKIRFQVIENLYDIEREYLGGRKIHYNRDGSYRVVMDRDCYRQMQENSGYRFAIDISDNENLVFFKYK